MYGIFKNFGTSQMPDVWQVFYILLTVIAVIFAFQLYLEIEKNKSKNTAK